MINSKDFFNSIFQRYSTISYMRQLEKEGDYSYRRDIDKRKQRAHLGPQ